MIVIDTHIWIWWIGDRSRLSEIQKDSIAANPAQEIGVSAISCWEIAKLVQKNKLDFSIPVEDWLQAALSYPGVQLIPLSPEIAVESTRLPGTFHRDPADQIIVATARVYECDLVTSDDKIVRYPHVTTIC